MTRFFVLSGHFFSPAEVDPWTGMRHDYSPRENYQQRFAHLARTCYGANSASRILGPDGKIRKIVNNYRSMAFSFAPALLDDLASAAPNVYRRIQEADRDSLASLGHGNALAQCWNPSVLPLLEPRQVRLQIEWGIAAFEKHFHRRPEGFWLPHQGVSDGVLDQLIQAQIPWILLSPWQAEAIMPADDGSWTALGDAPAPSDRVYRLDRPGGSIGVFFDDAGLVSGVGSDHLLRDASRFSQAIRDSVQEKPFTTLSAKGTLFGKEEPFADMCLAALWDKLEGPGGVQVVNYGVLWQQGLPAWQVRLKKGHNEEGTSADCLHGVQRWKSDCGCSSYGEPGWQQRWRAPLRKVLVTLEARIHEAETQALALWGLNREVWEASLPSLYLRQTGAREWALKLLPGSSPELQDRLLRWAWGVHWAQSMFGAPLWHYADPMLPMARAGLLAALRAIDLLASEVKLPLFEDLLQGLEIPGNGGRTLRQEVEQSLLKRRHGIEFPAALVLFDRLLRPRVWYQERLGPYQVLQFTRDKQGLPGAGVRFVGRLELHHVDLDVTTTLEYLLLEEPAVGVTLTLKTAGKSAKPQPFDLEWLPVGERNEIVQWLGADLEATLASEAQSFFPLLRKSLVYSRLLDVAPLPMTRSMMELAVTRKILELAEGSGLPSDEALASLETELAFAKDYGLNLDRERLNLRFSGWLFQALETPDEFGREAVVKAVETLLGKLYAWGFQPDITVAQSLVFEALQSQGPQLLAKLENGHIEALGELKRLLRLGGLLLIDTTELRARLLD